MKLQGWIFDLYPSLQGMKLWLITPEQTRHLLIDRFTPSFYAAGARESLRRLQAALETRARGVCARFAERTDIWESAPIETLAISVQRPSDFFAWARWVRQFDERLRLYNSDLMLASMYCWERRVFPLARVEISWESVEGENRVREIACLDSEWALDYETPPLEIMHMKLGGLSCIDPAHGRRTPLEVEAGGRTFELDESSEPAAVALQYLLKQHDPDLILTDWGDSAILPRIRRQAAQFQLRIPFNRDPDAQVQESRGRSYMSYGRVLFKNSATTLFGRLHVDTQNSFIADKCELAGLWELVRVTKLPVQYAARTTTGTGISYMQMELAHHDGVLIPEQKAEPEDPKSPDELLAADRGGLVFVPKLGFFANVAELDFVSEYPSIMARFNVSPETVNCDCCPETPRVPELGYRVCRKRRGITSRVVERLIEKRSEWKRRLREDLTLSKELARRYQLQRDALKWLLVCCFGYTGYKNARFGKIEAHEAINAYARETLLAAKELAEDRGFELLHAMVDSLYVHKTAATRQDYEDLLHEIAERTQLPLGIEAVYRFVAFLPSKQFEDIPVPNRFFAVSNEGELKIRGLECRRHDTPPLVARMQKEALALLAQARDYDGYCAQLREACLLLRRYEDALAGGEIAVEDLIISKRLTREPRDYKKAAHTAIAAQQLFGSGVRLRPGQTIEYIITDADSNVPNDRVRAYSLWEGFHGYDRAKYRAMLREAFAPFLALAPHVAEEKQPAAATPALAPPSARAASL
ncbi:MAG: DNA polymerase domain-containing protein [Candidatus Acidiferrales bacterium]